MKIKNILSPRFNEDNTKTLHETILKNFNKTPSGKIYENELKDIFAMMIICLNLKENHGSRRRLNPLNKQYPYSFQIEEALETMKQLHVKIELSKTTTNISYSIKPELGMALLRKFFDAKLLHSPADRTRSQPKRNVLIQPTPKGVALLQDFYKKIGGKRDSIPPILMSNLNSMDLFKFDRDPISDKILYSDYFLHLIFVKLMSNRPHTWSPDNKPDPLPPLDSMLEINEYFGDGCDMSILGVDKATLNLQNLYPGCEGVNFWDSPINGSQQTLKRNDKRTENDVSPIHHKYFTNPESDSHVQYYVSNSGVRFTQGKLFKSPENEDVIVNLCVSGKAICQWICDCTDVISIHHAIEITDLLLKLKLIVPITLGPSKANNSRFLADRYSFYLPSRKGLSIINWKNIDGVHLDSNDEEINDNTFNYNDITSKSVESFIDKCINKNLKKYSDSRVPILSLQDNLRDPGMRYLFKKHLEKEFCTENLEAYLQLKQFEKKITILSKLLIFKKNCIKSNSNALNCQIIQLANTCLAMAYHIYFTYLSSDAPFLLNINYNLKERITAIMMNKSIVSSATTQDYMKTPVIENNNSHLSNSTAVTVTEQAVLESSPTSPKLSLGKQADHPITHITGDSNIKRQDIVYQELDLGLKSPIEQNFKNTLNILVQVSVIFDATANQIYRLMEVDSFPKFLNSDIYKHATSYLELRKL